ncbi:hypothetical protein MPTK1_7g00030 [Marchantia polymorpha subsp. ruderalis]|uniref:Uncharacterized protein n=2 Tax=Marchantia polymorpha TaxID=3197 RepID=A0AAF6BUK9_MARPO|nr:hypothetical protein MARPO_0046s0121 [Marchantia polymorpha]BBN15693.1 hypothetical protein Mp_7g00030 [Marchantia polymorpha subsp. ruderalis]|eukprot:PTQ39314.1 hypothetical protein MARPO_0046s0121 [Marchantia polymorpha]
MGPHILLRDDLFTEFITVTNHCLTQLIDYTMESTHQLFPFISEAVLSHERRHFQIRKEGIWST